MRKPLLAACLLSMAAASATAQSSDTGFQPKGLRPFIGVGLAAGGDTLLRVRTDVQNGPDYQSNVRAGDGLDLRAGLSLRLGDLPWSLQAVAAYHNDQTNGIEGSKYRFRRMPVEATLLWHATDRARIGFGVRKSLQPKVKVTNGRATGSNGNAITGINVSYDMKASTGFIVEGEYAVTPGWSLKGRYVYETFRYKDFPDADKEKGDHIAIQSVWYLN